MTLDLPEFIATAQSAGVTIAVAESCTGGLLAAALTESPGASAVFDRGFVTYSNAAKVEMLGVSEASLSTYGAVSQQVAEEMARGALGKSGANLAVSITGIAGPGGSDHKPEGRVCFGLAIAGQPDRSETVEFGALGRENLRNAARDHALDLLQQAVVSIRRNLQK
ncbi:CinA family protein [Parasedimentitalea psychrophila]|uniref:CinA family protein n=1 Tax=Parasedimentitalea psychrophila TaxID=2997337 RepID=A0A9Y2P431_9RHOB|nr:CinA family protein [Parasedimentitalea psychrophila]WIY24884.1 CinA family protein [Parasedimentitalea psychrophila]